MKALLEYATRYERDRKITYTWRGPVGDDNTARAVELAISHNKDRRVYFVTFSRYEIETCDGFTMKRHGMFDGSLLNVGARPTARYSNAEMNRVFDTVIECDLTNDPGAAQRFIAEAAALTMTDNGVAR